MAKCVSCKKVKTCPFADDDSAYCDHFEQKPRSNADRIRSMSDEELAELLTCNDGFCCPVEGADCTKEPSCTDCFSRWMKKECDE